MEGEAEMPNFGLVDPLLLMKTKHPPQQTKAFKVVMPATPNVCSLVKQVTENKDDLTIDRQKVSHVAVCDEQIGHEMLIDEEIIGLSHKSSKPGFNQSSLGQFSGTRKNSVSLLPISRQNNTQNCLPPKNNDTKEVQDFISKFNQPTFNTEYKIVSDDVAEENILNLKNLKSTDCEIIGQGTFGTVFKSRIPEHVKYIVKKISKQYKVNANEVLVPLQFKNCVNILNIHALYVQDCSLHIVQQNCGQSLKQLLRSDEKFIRYVEDTYNSVNFMAGMFNAGAYLENAHVVHGDLKLENVCAALEEKGIYKAILIDFGTCQTSTDTPSLDGISPEFLSPMINSFVLHQLKIFPLPPDQKMPEKQGSLLIDEKADTYSITLIGLCILNKGEHPVKEVREYPCKYPVSFKQRVNAMQAIANLTDEKIDEFMPHGLNMDVRKALRDNLWVDAQKRCGAKGTMQILENISQRKGDFSQDRCLSQWRGQKRPFTCNKLGKPPFTCEDQQPWTVDKKDQMVQEELMNMFDTKRKKPYIVPKHLIPDGQKDLMSRVVMRPCLYPGPSSKPCPPVGGIVVTDKKVVGNDMPCQPVGGFVMTDKKVFGNDMPCPPVGGFVMTDKKVVGNDMPCQPVGGFVMTDKKVVGNDMPCQPVGGFVMRDKKVFGNDMPCQPVGGFVMRDKKVFGNDMPCQPVGGFVMRDKKVFGNDMPCQPVGGFVMRDKKVFGNDMPCQPVGDFVMRDKKVFGNDMPCQPVGGFVMRDKKVFGNDMPLQPVGGFVLRDKKVVDNDNTESGYPPLQTECQPDLDVEMMNIPDMSKLDTPSSPQTKVRRLTTKVVQPEEDVVIEYNQPIPDFDLLGMEQDITKEQQPTVDVTGRMVSKKGRRRNNASKSKK